MPSRKPYWERMRDSLGQGISACKRRRSSSLSRPPGIEAASYDPASFMCAILPYLEMHVNLPRISPTGDGEAHLLALLLFQRAGEVVHRAHGSLPHSGNHV